MVKDYGIQSIVLRQVRSYVSSNLTSLILTYKKTNIMDVNTKYYIGDAKKLFQIQKLIANSEFSKEDRDMIIEEYNKLSLANQGMRRQLNNVIETVNNIIKKPF